MKPARLVLFVAGLLVVAAITWLVLTKLKPPATWLTVEASSRALAGGLLKVRISITEPAGDLHLTVDLHGWTRNEDSLGAISHARPRRVSPPGQPMEFELAIPDQPDLTKIRAIIFLSPSGGWADHVRGVATDEIPVEYSSQPGKSELEALRAYELAPDPVIPRLESPLLRAVIIGLWLIVAGGVAWRLKQARAALIPKGEPGWRLSGSLLIIGLCLAAVLVELFNLEQVIGDLARAFVQRQGFYGERHLPQQLAVIFTVVGATALGSFALARTHLRRTVLGWLIYAAISLTATLSLHESDALLYSSIFGLPVEQLAKLAAVSLSLWGLQAVVGRSDP